MTYTAGMPAFAAVQSACTVIMALPSPMMPTTGLSGLASLTPSVPPMPQPKAPPVIPSMLPGSSKSMAPITEARVVMESSTMIVSPGRALAISVIMRSVDIGPTSQRSLTRWSHAAFCAAFSSASETERPLAASFAEPDIVASRASASSPSPTLVSEMIPTSVGSLLPISPEFESR